MSSSFWRRKPQKWHRSNPIRGYVPSQGAFSARTRHTGLPKQSHKQTFRPGKTTNFGGYPRTTRMGRIYQANTIRSVSRGIHSSGLSRRPIPMGRGVGPYFKPFALGVGSGGKSQALVRAQRHGSTLMRITRPTGRRSYRNLYIAGGVAAVGTGAYAVHRRRRRTKRDYKGRFAGSY